MEVKKKEGDLSKWVGGPVGIETLAVHGGTVPDPLTGAILQPIHASTTFVQPSVQDYLSKGYSYTRQDNPTVRALEQRIASLENGVNCVCVSSGMAATTTVLSAFLASGDHCILPDCSYGGTNRCARVHFSKYGIQFSYVDMRDVGTIERAITPATKLIFTESPTNPILRLTDVKAVSVLARRKGILHVCDSTFATPYLMRPLDLGTDMVIQSTTKYYDGHNVTIGGAIIVRTSELYETLALQRNILGNIMTPQVAFLTLQTVKTLPLRVERQSVTALKVALFLKTHSKVISVSYPGLPDFSQRALAEKQHLGGLHGGMVCFEVAGGTEAGQKLMNIVKRPWTLCENLGACESIITCPAVFTHANMLREDRLKVGITDGLVRLSCGIESPDDLIRALREALDAL